MVEDELSRAEPENEFFLAMWNIHIKNCEEKGNKLE